MGVLVTMERKTKNLSDVHNCVKALSDMQELYSVEYRTAVTYKAAHHASVLFWAQLFKASLA